jgi:hypothetical protein
VSTKQLDRSLVHVVLISTLWRYKANSTIEKFDTYAFTDISQDMARDPFLHHVVEPSYGSHRHTNFIRHISPNTSDN